MADTFVARAGKTNKQTKRTRVNKQTTKNQNKQNENEEVRNKKLEMPKIKNISSLQCQVIS